MSENQILSLLKYPTYRKVFESCIDAPRTAKEMQSLLGLSRSDLVAYLEELETLRAIAFSNGKWSATALGIKVYRKYFG